VQIKDPNWKNSYDIYISTISDKAAELKHISFKNFGMNWGIWHYELEKDFKSFVNLESIDLSNNNIDTIIIDCSKMPLLKSVDLSHNALYYWGHEGSFIIDQQINAPNLERLNLSYGKLGNVIIGQKAPFLETLQWLDLSGNHFSDYHLSYKNSPPRLQLPVLPNLKYLSLKDNFYGYVPKLRYLRSIETIDLSNNPVKANFQELNLLPNLKEIILNNTGLTKTPDSFFKMNSLTKLELKNNFLSNNEIKRLTKHFKSTQIIY
jgi:Leucine-rich repeat (LRR) protein